MTSSPTDEKKAWKRKEILSLIQTYESMPELWNSNYSGYKDRKKKMQSMIKLTEPYDTTIDEVKRKIHNLRCQFSAELRKIKKKSAEHNIDESLVFSEWRFFEPMKFLRDIYSGIPKYPVTKNHKVQEATRSVTLQNTQDALETSESDEELHDEPSTSKCFTPKLNKPERVYITSDHNSTKLLSVSSDDDHRIFGEYVALELRNLNERNAKKLMLKIRKAILEVAEEEFNSEDVVKCDYSNS